GHQEGPAGRALRRAAGPLGGAPARPAGLPRAGVPAPRRISPQRLLQGRGGQAGAPRRRGRAARRGLLPRCRLRRVLSRHLCDGAALLGDGAAPPRCRSPAQGARRHAGGDPPARARPVRRVAVGPLRPVGPGLHRRRPRGGARRDARGAPVGAAHRGRPAGHTAPGPPRGPRRRAAALRAALCHPGAPPPRRARGRASAAGRHGAPVPRALLPGGRGGGRVAGVLLVVRPQIRVLVAS
ncbi:unnamed protein product, partial [Prorocentrum cordatum]